MSLAILLKDNLKNIPPYIGQIINHIPYERRPGIGKVYRQRKSEILKFSESDIANKQTFVFERVVNLVKFAYGNIKFYNELYDKSGFHPTDLYEFADIQRIPIITKSMLNEYAIDERSFPQKGRYVVNTGGSSGTPFGFYIEPSSMGHEWAHMHTIWRRLNYMPTDLKLVFGGRSDVKNLVEYDVVRNHFAIDIYASYAEVSAKLKIVLRNYKIKYLHGYPSSIYDFAIYCRDYDTELLTLLKDSLQGAFLGSEYPHKYYRDAIEGIFNILTISWYGHTERTILAYEKEEHFTYSPFLSYGFAESIRNEGGSFDLVGTSYYNYASPLIRYNAEDSIENPVVEDGILESFQILKGRSGEIVIDRLGKKINLTGLIFGRHHELFNVSKFVQIKQIDVGVIEIYFVSDSIEEEIAGTLFDSSNLNFNISFKKIKEPIRSISGKVGLLIR